MSRYLLLSSLSPSRTFWWCWMRARVSTSYHQPHNDPPTQVGVRIMVRIHHGSALVPWMHVYGTRIRGWVDGAWLGGSFRLFRLLLFSFPWARSPFRTGVQGRVAGNPLPTVAATGRALSWSLGSGSPVDVLGCLGVPTCRGAGRGGESRGTRTRVSCVVVVVVVD